MKLFAHLHYNAEEEIGIEVHMVDAHGYGDVSRLPGFHKKLQKLLKIEGGEPLLDNCSYTHLKRHRHKRMQKDLNGEWRRYTQIKVNNEYIHKVVEMFDAGGCKNCKTSSSPELRKKLMKQQDEIFFLDDQAAQTYRSCTRCFLFMAQDRRYVQFEVSLLTAYLGTKPMTVDKSNHMKKLNGLVNVGEIPEKKYIFKDQNNKKYRLDNNNKNIELIKAVRQLAGVASQIQQVNGIEWDRYDEIIFRSNIYLHATDISVEVS